MKVENLKPKRILPRFLLWTAIALSLCPGLASAKLDMIEVTRKSAEAQVRNLIEPVINRFCHDECKLLAINATVDIATPDEIAPGFDEVEARAQTLAASSARVRLLINEKVGPVSRSKLMDLLQRYLDTLDYPVKIETQLARFPEPIEASGKVAELRERVTKQFTNTLEELFQQFCPNQCLLTDLNLKTELVNGEEVEYGSAGEFVQEGGVAIRIKELSASILIDDALSPVERSNILEMAKLKTTSFKQVNLTSKALKFPRPNAVTALAGGSGIDPLTGKTISRNLASESTVTNSTENRNSNTTAQTQTSSNTNTVTSTNNENAVKQERFERIEKIERVESGDAVQAELQKFKVFGLIFGCSILSLLVFLAIASYRPKASAIPTVHRIFQNLAADPVSASAPSTYKPSSESLPGKDDRGALAAKRYEIETLLEELTKIFVQQPKVAKQVFSRILTEEGVEVTAQYIHMLGESIVVDMLRDPSLQSDISELMEYYAKTPIEITDDEKLNLLRALHNRTVAGKLFVMGNRSSNLFDFLAEMDGLQILELIRNESLTVKSIVLTQCDPQKRATIYAQLEDDTRLKLLTELSRIDHLPRDYIFNVANALKRKRIENPRLNTESLPGSEVLVSLLERTGPQMQRTVVKSLEAANPESARTIKSKLVSLDTLRYLRDGQLLEVILSLKHDELLQFLKGAPDSIRYTIFSKAPKELISELEEELGSVGAISREMYQAVERKILNRMKLMTNEGLINLVETNERMFADSAGDSGFVQPVPSPSAGDKTVTNLKKVAGW
ncbi:MAG: hypothetical protein A2428_13975 [Bdellovibrionales bacterium RIFOXYC1_FULL_54_43]|nr:MAG: hypothetical protein A2428_13975 [Bdellovibrionales bacterium RIFOXYC1_FULL_54_43]OFZ85622.1 MAG: hypothetical protein A2603_01410 [Bdellovibrionales bacterium RIFOXYD1_FULL_55_31]